MLRGLLHYNLRRQCVLRDLQNLHVMPVSNTTDSCGGLVRISGASLLSVPSQGRGVEGRGGAEMSCARFSILQAHV